MEPSYYQNGILIKMEHSYYQNGILIKMEHSSKWNPHIIKNGTLILKGSLGSIDEGVLDRASASSCVTVILWVLQPQIQRRPRSCFCFLL